MNRDSHSKRSETSRKPLSAAQIAVRLLILCIVVGLLGVSGALLIRTFNQSGQTASLPIDLPINPDLGALEAVALGGYLSLNEEALNTPISSDEMLQQFEIVSGESASQISERLAGQNLISDADLFRNYLRYYGLDVQLEAGFYELSASMTIPEIATTLTDAQPPEITVRITEGWRREQIADWIDREGILPFTGAEFLAATANAGGLPADSPVRTDLPANASLEGYLFPDTYRLPIDAAAADLVSRMIENFDRQVTMQMRADAAGQGLTTFQVVTVASIVEREAAVAEERPMIASVYLNRLASGMKLEADPTVQYAMGYQYDSGEWWNPNLTQNDYYAVDSPYNLYLYEGLSPGPIANPGLSSIQAVVYPAETTYFYFRAACDGSGRHVFAETFEEHIANACP